VLAFGGGLVLGIDGGNRVQRLNDGRPMGDRVLSSLSEEQATALASEATVEIAFAIGFAAVMLACGALAVWFGTSGAR
jgi:hypothetical protein